MSDITPLLLDAKKEYTSRLEEIVTPQIRATFQALYAECMEDGSTDVYICFQAKMREIPFWNSGIVQQKTQQLITSYSFFENLCVAVVVTYVKVLSAIRLGEGRPSVKLKVPRTDEFVHEIYKQMAMICYYEPFVVEDRETFETRAIPEAIERSIRRLIPYDEILDSYLAPEEENTPPAPQQASDSESESESDEDDDDDEDINVSVPSAHAGSLQQPVGMVGTMDTPQEVPSALQDTGGISDDEDVDEPPSYEPQGVMNAAPVQQAAPVVMHAPVPQPAQPSQPAAGHPMQAVAQPTAQPTQPAAPPQLFGQQEIRQTM